MSQGHIQRTKAPSDRRCERTFDGNAVFRNVVKGIFRQGVIRPEFFLGFFACQEFMPDDPSFAPIGFCHGVIKDRTCCSPDIGACTVSLDIGNDGSIRDPGAALRIPGKDVTAFQRLIFRHIVALHLHLKGANQSMFSTRHGMTSLRPEPLNTPEVYRPQDGGQAS